MASRRLRSVFLSLTLMVMSLGTLQVSAAESLVAGEIDGSTGGTEIRALRRFRQLRTDKDLPVRANQYIRFTKAKSSKGKKSKKSSKGKGKGDAVGKGKGKGKGKGSSSNLCKKYDFLDWYRPVQGKGKGSIPGKGKGTVGTPGKGSTPGKGTAPGKGKGSTPGKGKGIVGRPGKGKGSPGGKGNGFSRERPGGSSQIMNGSTTSSNAVASAFVSPAQDSSQSTSTSSWKGIYGRKLQFGGEGCDPNSLETAARNPNLSIFVELIKAAGLQDIFDCAGPFTVLAPSNAVFEANPSLLQYYRNPRNKKELEQTLLYHMLPGFYRMRDFETGDYKSLEGGLVSVTKRPLQFNQAGVLQGDILACNGVIHIIDDTLIRPGNDYIPEECADLDFRGLGQSPNQMNGFFNRSPFMGELCSPNLLEAARRDPNLSVFVTLIEAAGLDFLFWCAGPFTALAPSNAAFNRLDPAILEQLLNPANIEELADILLYHLLPGAHFSTTLQTGPYDTLRGDSVEVTLNPIRFDGVGVIDPDNAACNGVIHVIEDVLTLERVPAICEDFTFGSSSNSTNDSTNGGDSSDNALCEPNVITTAEQQDLTTFVELINLAGLGEIFLCPGPFTAWIPTNEAFANLPGYILDFLADPANRELLREVLLYHLMGGIFLSTQLSPGQLPTLEGSTVTIGVDPLTINEIGVIEVDIEACNGIIDTIDGVLFPPGFPTIAAPTFSPTAAPTFPQPTHAPTLAPTREPTFPATDRPTMQLGSPTEAPIAVTAAPTARPTSPPTPTPGTPSLAPVTPEPSVSPTARPTVAPVLDATPDPTATPTLTPTASPTAVPIADATSAPTIAPTLVPTPATAPDESEEPSGEPSGIPSFTPTQIPGGTASPTEVPGPTQEPLIRIPVRDYYIAYVIPDFTAATDEEIDALLQVTEEFWEGYFQERYPEGNAIQYRGIQLVINEVRFGAGIPDEKFNLWIDFNTTILYELDSADPPDAQETFDIMASAEFTEYILQYVRQLTERTGVDPNPFRRNNEVVFRASERIVEVPASGRNNGPASEQRVVKPVPMPSRRPEDLVTMEESEDSNIPLASIVAAGAVALSLLTIGMLVARRKKSVASQDYGKAMMEARTFEGTVTDETSMGSLKTSMMNRRAGPFPIANSS